jgi:hypothetical protein
VGGSNDSGLLYFAGAISVTVNAPSAPSALEEPFDDIFLDAAPEPAARRTMSAPPTNSPFTWSCGMVGQLAYCLMPSRTSMVLMSRQGRLLVKKRAEQKKAVLRRPLYLPFPWVTVV